MGGHRGGTGVSIGTTTLRCLDPPLTPVVLSSEGSFPSVKKSVDDGTTFLRPEHNGLEVYNLL